MSAESARLLGASLERDRIRKAQRNAIRNLRDLLDITDCLTHDFQPPMSGCTGTKERGKHAEDCGYGQLRGDIRALDAATREPRR